MKTVGVLMLALVGSTYAAMPGQCKDERDCTKLPTAVNAVSPFACVSVQTSRSNAIDVKQCVPRTNNSPVCSGITPGLCPTFSLWTSAYRSISTVCSLAPPIKPIKCGAAPSGSASGTGKGTVQCVDVNAAGFKGAAYQCVDFDGTRLMFNKGNDPDKFAIAMNYTSIVLDKCVRKGGDVLCTGHGTCAPTSAGQSNYQCLCNMGYSGNFCENIVSGQCATSAQCDAGECDSTSFTCKCPPGTTGKKCEQCDTTASAEEMCGGHGKCTTTKRRFLMALANSNSNSTSSNSTAGPGTVSAAKTSTNSSSSTMTTNANSNSTSSTSSTSQTVAGNFCVCDTGFSGPQCERKANDGLKPNKTASAVPEEEADKSLASSVTLSSVASIALVVVAAALF